MAAKGNTKGAQSHLGKIKEIKKDTTLKNLTVFWN